MAYKVIFHSGQTISLKTKVKSGRLPVENGQLKITGNSEIQIHLESAHTVEVFRLHGLGRMIKLVHNDGTLFVSVVRLCLFGRFAVINSFRTRELYRRLDSTINKHAT
jgi:hypothetical protein